MSWSIDTSKPHTRLENAIMEANKKRIIMFCASIDEGVTALDNTYPGKMDSCIKIGASTGTGAKLSWVSDHDFLFPGEVPKPAASETNLWTSSHVGSSGSSVSTALAAGLAGVLLYCDRLAGTLPIPIDPNPSGREGTVSTTNKANSEIEKVDPLRHLSNMSIAFTYLSRGTNKPHRSGITSMCSRI